MNDKHFSEYGFSYFWKDILLPMLKDFEGKITNIFSIVTNNSQQISMLNKKTDSHDESISNLESRVDDHDTSIENLKTTVNEHDTSINNLESKTGDYDETISNIEKKNGFLGVQYC